MQNKKSSPLGRLLQGSTLLLPLLAPAIARSQFVAFNDHAPGTIGVTTSSNATTYNIFGRAPGASGPLKDISSAVSLPVTLTITTNGNVVASPSAANPSPGTPLFNIFNGYVDFQGAGNPDAAAQLYPNATVTYTFSGLNTNRTYSFMGSAVRGGSGGTYPQRWTTFQLNGARSFRSAHTAGCYTNGLAINQVAINTGVNTNGDMADWESILPALNGTISIVSTQYQGAIPIGGTANGPYAYALTGFRLVEFSPPTIQSAAAVGNNAVQVVFSIPVSAATAMALTNYSITNLVGTVPVLGAAFVNDTKTIQLTTATLAPYATQWLTVNRVADAATGLSVIATNTQVLLTNVPFTMGYIQRQLYFNVTGGPAVSILTNSPKFPNSPDQVDYQPNMGWPVENIADNYGGRFSGILVPPLTGNYYFAIRSDDASVLYLSPNNNPAYKSVITSEPACCESFDAHTNGPFLLNAGQRYYIEALMKENLGSDYLYVAWKTPTNLSWTVISGTALGNYLNVAGSSLTILQQPTSTTGMADYTATFTVAASGSSVATTTLNYQWQLNGFDIAGATTAKYTTPTLHASDNGSLYRVLVAIPGKALLSANATLTVVPDTIPPTVIRAFNLGPTNVQLVFSKPVDPASATSLLNYGFSGGVSIGTAALDSSSTNVILTTTPLVYGSNYSVTINNVRDQAVPPNTVAANTIVTFLASPYAPQDIGNPAIPSSVTILTNGLNVTAAGSDLGGVSDQFNFNCQVRSGDFDVSARVAGLSLADVWTKAGLIARETLDPASRFAAALATPTMTGCFFEFRDPAYSASRAMGSFPANYPYTWLRLKRAGNQFTGFAGYDGQTWTQLGSVSIAMATQIYFGFAVSSHNSAQAAIAQFRDIADVGTNAVAGALVNPHEPMGPCSRLTPVVISEIMYKPAPRTDTNNLEFLELYNSNPYYQDISGYQVVCADMNYTFPPGTVMAGGAYLVIAASPTSIRSVYGITNVLGPYTGSLKKSETLELLDEREAIILTVPYSNGSPWPVAADGTGHSLVLARPTYGEGDPRAWDISDVVGGSPGAMDAFRPSPLRNVVINEFLAHSDPPYSDFVELYNHANQPVDISGCVLTDDPATNKFLIPAGTVIPAAGFVSFDEITMQFGLAAPGATLYFKNSDQSRILDAVQYAGQGHNVSNGRWPDGAGEFYPLAIPTPGGPNTNILLSDVVIDELMYAPISGNDDDQYVELYNRSANPVDLSGWQLADAISFTIPTNTILAPDGYLVVARNAARLRANYSNLNTTNCLGDFGGKLSHKGEHLALTMPDVIHLTNTIQVTVNDLTYGTGGRWGQWSHGGGSSLELINPNVNNRLAYNWADSDETMKSVWTNLEYTGVLDNGANYTNGPINLVQLGLMDVGECLVDNVEVRPGGINGPNIIANSDFEIDLSNWSPQGDHIRSSLETALGGYQSSQSLHLRSSDSVWTLGDGVQGMLTQTTLGAGQTATLRLKARWLAGWPEVLMRLRGNWLEVTGGMPVPANLGTPGMPNSRYVTYPGPAIYEVKHSPPLPSANQPVVVTARFHDFNPFRPTLLYRIDTGVNPFPAYNYLPMVDDGTGDDAVAGDGVYTATIPAQTNGTVVAFLVQAQDLIYGPITTFPADLQNNAGVPRECVVAFGDPIPTGSFGHHHVFITQNWAQRWANGGGVSHETHDGTWVDSGGRIVYDWMGRYAGSPYHQYLGSPVTTIGGMHWLMPEDDQVFGTTSFNKQHVPGNGPLDDNTLQREQAAFWMARQIGLPVQNRRFYVYYVNGVRHAPLMEDAQVPGAEMLKEYFPNDSNGVLYKNHSWFEGDINQQANAYMSFNNKSWCLLGKFTTTINGVPNLYKLARYRWMWWIRQFPDSANNFNDVFALIDAANTPTNLPAYYANMESQVDTDEWLRLSAMEHATGDWDSFFTQNQWNMYCYKPTMGKWTALKWDWNITLGSGTQTWPPDGSKLFTTGANDPVMATFQNYPAYRRTYLRALQDIANLAMNNAVVNPLLDAKYAAFAANGLATTAYNGLTVVDPAVAGGLESWIGTMHNSILTALVNQGVSSVPFMVNMAVVNNNAAQVGGTAPLAVKNICFNGIPYPVTWTSVTTWLVTVPLLPGLNNFNIVGVDPHGRPVPGATNSVAVNYGGSVPSPVGQVLINEIMYNPAVPNAQYVELYNRSATSTFDLSGWQLQGLGYTFPSGSLLTPNSFLVLVSNPSAFSAAYGGTIPIFDTVSAPLQTGGQTLVLVRPGTNAAINLVVTGTRFGAAPPWPPGANGLGSSLQLIDPGQDNWRPGNWAGSFPPAALSPGTTNTALASLPSFPPLWLNELQADNLTGITNSAGQHTPWVELYNPSTNIVSLSGLYLANDYSNLTAWAFPAGASINPGEFKVIFADSQTNLSTLAELHTSFTLQSGSGSLALSRLYNSQPQVLDYIDYANLGLNHSLGSFPDGQCFYRQEFLHVTPGSANDGTTFPSSIPYAIPAAVYAQDFNTLPDPGAASVNTANPVTINGVTYSLSNPYDFAFPATASGNAGGLGLPGLAGWHGLSALLSRFGATDGDQTTGGQISFGPPSSTNRALGLLATTSTGATAFGARFINKTTNVLHFINLQFTGELWRQSDKSKILEFYYLIDPAGTNAFSTNYTAFLPALNVAFPANPADVGGVPVDGTSPANQTNLSVINQAITNWPPAAALWLVWEMADSGGKAQGLAIDNLSFSSAPGLPNTAPVLAPLSDRFVILGQTLTFTASATDTDQPPESLTFTLGAAAPSGAAIAPSSGQFSWTPPSAPATNAISIIVTDNGTPSLSATQSFTVTVFSPPQLQNLSLNGNQFTFSWLSLNTQTYQVEYSTNLTAGAWTPLGTPVSGTGTLRTFTNSPATISQGFFRLRILP
ncbi:MAG TPA: lamin tail domain-containing protein [Candidatus Acidoferrum sp.]|nr:lamin tail domain-containing protein [Candidatus Acidoferrum sp.]